MRHFCFRRALAAAWCAGLLTVSAAAPYYLTVYRQRVSIYETQTGRWYVTATPAGSLPVCDREALERGIPLESAEACTAALEDFCS